MTLQQLYWLIVLHMVVCMLIWHKEPAMESALSLQLGGMSCNHDMLLSCR